MGEGPWKHGDKTSGFIRGRKFLENLSDSQLPKKGVGPWN